MAVDPHQTTSKCLPQRSKCHLRAFRRYKQQSIEQHTHGQAGKEFKVLEQKIVNDWQDLEITMSTVVKKMFSEVIKPSELDFRVDMSAIDTCTAKDYGIKVSNVV